MVTYYNEKDVVSFGKFMLSKEREQNKINARDEMIRQGLNPPPIGEFISDVTHADVENWKFEENLRKSKNFLNTLGVTSQVIFCRAPTFMFNRETGQSSYVPNMDEPGFYPVRIETFSNITAQALKDNCAGCWCIFYIHDGSKLMTNEMGVIENLQATFIPRKAEDLDSKFHTSAVAQAVAAMRPTEERFIVIPDEFFDTNDHYNPNFQEDINDLIDQTCQANKWKRADDAFVIIADKGVSPKASFLIV